MWVLGQRRVACSRSWAGRGQHVVDAVGEIQFGSSVKANFDPDRPIRESDLALDAEKPFPRVVDVGLDGRGLTRVEQGGTAFEHVADADAFLVPRAVGDEPAGVVLVADRREQPGRDVRVARAADENGGGDAADGVAAADLGELIADAVEPVENLVGLLAGEATTLGAFVPLDLDELREPHLYKIGVGNDFNIRSARTVVCK
ncbi:MAG: hypothetical protein J07HN6_00910 [Halonotius sp. J07HN6]|nr:MAG: hypothetical protein J07HN6_00910 [Halonotius sp. J07HN6]